MESTLINQGFMLMLVGMGTVFVFLTLLVATMTLMSGVVTRLTPAAALPDAANAEELAAIAAAVELHRQRQNQNTG